MYCACAYADIAKSNQRPPELIKDSISINGAIPDSLQCGYSHGFYSLLCTCIRTELIIRSVFIFFKQNEVSPSNVIGNYPAIVCLKFYERASLLCLVVTQIKSNTIFIKIHCSS